MKNQQIRGDTRLIGLLGWPVAHSLSPQIHNHALACRGLPFAYVPLPVAPSNLHAAVQALRDCGFVGANVTIPHKRQVLHYCDSVSDISARIGAVNTLYFTDNMLCGTTTDPQGFFRALASMGHDPTDGRIVILGNGGTARTIGFSLALQKNPSSLTLVGRDEARVTALSRDIAQGSGKQVDATTFSSPRLKAVLDECTLCVNCTSVGMHPNVDQSPLPASAFHRGMTVFDTIYNPLQTRFLRDAQLAGCLTQNGLRMLLNQGLESLKLWTGVEVSEDIFDLDELGRSIA
jgi:shikimate dehydrogenase